MPIHDILQMRKSLPASHLDLVPEPASAASQRQVLQMLVWQALETLEQGWRGSRWPWLLPKVRAPPSLHLPSILLAASGQSSVCLLQQWALTVF